MIFFECYADESVLKFLGFNKKDLRGGHSFGRSNVSFKLKKVTDSIGLVDEDPNKAKDPYLMQLLGTRPLHIDRYFIYVKDSKNNNHLIVLRPDQEGFVLQIAKDRNVDLSTERYKLANAEKDS